MNSVALSKFDKLRRSPAVRGISLGILAVFILVYLAIITFSLSDHLDSPARIALLVFLWCIGIVALVLLSRPWRNFFRSNRIQSDKKTLER